MTETLKAEVGMKVYFLLSDHADVVERTIAKVHKNGRFILENDTRKSQYRAFKKSWNNEFAIAFEAGDTRYPAKCYPIDSVTKAMFAARKRKKTNMYEYNRLYDLLPRRIKGDEKHASRFIKELTKTMVNFGIETAKGDRPEQS